MILLCLVGNKLFVS